MTKRLALLTAGLAAAATFSAPAPASAEAPCLVFGVWECLGPYGDRIKEVLDHGAA
jgi:hypothetical protein